MKLTSKNVKKKSPANILKEKEVAGEEINAGSTMILIIRQKSKVKSSRKPKLNSSKMNQS